MIEANNISAGYNKKSIITNFSATFMDYQITAIIGANGSGKSTLLKACAGHIMPIKGRVNIDYKYIKSVKIAQLLSYLPQGRQTPDMTVEQMVLHGRFAWSDFPRIYTKKDFEIVENAMKKTGIISKRHSLLKHISGGERQKAYISMALAQATKHILLDEPSSNLDICITLELNNILKDLKATGKCIIIVMHDIAQALEISDSIVVIKDGMLLKQGTPDEILSSGVLEKAFNVNAIYKKQLSFMPIK